MDMDERVLESDALAQRRRTERLSTPQWFELWRSMSFWVVTTSVDVTALLRDCGNS
jgi:hypothetical protein